MTIILTNESDIKTKDEAGRSAGHSAGDGAQRRQAVLSQLRPVETQSVAPEDFRDFIDDL